MKNIKIDEVRAGELVDEFFDYYEIEVEKGDSDDDIALIKAAHQAMKKAVMRGRLDFKEDPEKGMQVIQHFRRPIEVKTGENIESVTYREIYGAAKCEMKHAKQTDIAGRQQRLMGALSGKGHGIFSRMTGVDYSLMETLSTVFFLV